MMVSDLTILPQTQREEPTQKTTVRVPKKRQEDLEDYFGLGILVRRVLKTSFIYGFSWEAPNNTVLNSKTCGEPRIA